MREDMKSEFEADGKLTQCSSAHIRTSIGGSFPLPPNVHTEHFFNGQKKEEVLGYCLNIS